MKTAYLLMDGAMQPNGQYVWYNPQLFSSHAKVRDYIDRSYSVNRGVGLTESTPWQPDEVHVTYRCLSTEGQPMTVYLKYTRLIIQ